MTIESSTYDISYTGNGVTTTFAYNFKITANSDLSVYVDDVLKTLTTHYTVTGVGVDSGGNVVFGIAPANSTTIYIARKNIAYTQETDYTEQDPFPAETHEAALDKLTLLSQQLKLLVDKCIKFPFSETLVSQLAAVDTRAGQFLKFDGDGNLDYDSVIVGDPEENFIQVGSGAVSRTFQDKVRERVSVTDFGAVGDGSHDDTTAIQNAITSVTSTLGTVYFPSGTFKITSMLQNNGVSLSGAGRYITKIKAYAAMTAVLEVSGDCIIEGIGFDGNSNTYATDAIKLNACNGTEFRYCAFDYAIRNGVDAPSGNNNHVDFIDCAARYNGTIVTLNVTYVSGNNNITVNSGTVPTARLREGDLLVISGVSPTPMLVGSSTTSSNIYVSFAPTSSGTANASYIYGSGFYCNAVPDSNIWGFINPYAVNNKLAGMNIQSLYAPTITNLQSDANYFGLVIGNRGVPADQNAPYKVVVTGLYMETNTGPAEWAHIQSFGTLIVEMNEDSASTPWYADSAGVNNLRMILNGVTCKPFGASGTLKSIEPLLTGTIYSGGGIGAGSTYTRNYTTGFDCTFGLVAINVTCWGGGENSQDPTNVGWYITNQTSSGFSVIIKNNGAAGQTLYGMITVFQVA